MLQPNIKLPLRRQNLFLTINSAQVILLKYITSINLLSDHNQWHSKEEAQNAHSYTITET